MATVNFINRPKGQTRGGLHAVLSYAMKPEKTAYEGTHLISGVNCSPGSVYHEFINTKLINGKCNGRMYYHFVQAFPKTEKVTPRTAHEIALKLADFYKGYEILVCTHTDREHIHSHFIVNSVSLETGKKLHQSAQAIQNIRNYSDELCREYGLSICQPKEHRTKPMTAGEYHSAERGKSWKIMLMNTIDECMKYALNKDMFLELMEAEGYSVKWTAARKNITYETFEGYKCRDNKLHEEKYLKERMENEFEIRRKIIIGGTENKEQAYSEYQLHGVTESVYGDYENYIRKSEDNDKLDYSNSRDSITTEESDKSNRKQNQLYSNGITNQGNEQQYSGNKEKTFTGWEKERMELIFKIQTASFQMSENQLDSNNNFANVISSTLGDIAKLGSSLGTGERNDKIVDSTTQIVVHERKHRVYQKENDIKDQGYKLSL